MVGVNRWLDLVTHSFLFRMNRKRVGRGEQKGLKSKGERVGAVGGFGGRKPFVAEWTSTDNPWHPAPGE